MNGQAIAAIGGVVGLLCKFLTSSGLAGKWASVAAVIISAMCVTIYVYSFSLWSRQTTWDIFSGWAAILMVAAGAFHIIENAPESVKRMAEK